MRYRLPDSSLRMRASQGSSSSRRKTLLVKDHATGIYLQKVLSPDEAQDMFSIKVDTAKTMHRSRYGGTPE
jgi:hypothetical protein